MLELPSADSSNPLLIELTSSLLDIVQLYSNTQRQSKEIVESFSETLRLLNRHRNLPIVTSSAYHKEIFARYAANQSKYLDTLAAALQELVRGEEKYLEDLQKLASKDIVAGVDDNTRAVFGWIEQIHEELAGITRTHKQILCQDIGPLAFGPELVNLWTGKSSLILNTFQGMLYIYCNIFSWIR